MKLFQFLKKKLKGLIPEEKPTAKITGRITSETEPKAKIKSENIDRTH